MPKKTQRPTATSGQLEPLLKAYALKRLEGQSVGQSKAPRAKPQAKKRKAR
jgi:hypothetical protein